MSQPAICVEHLSKQYQIGSAQPRYRTIRDQLVEAGRRMLARRRSDDRASHVWALLDVSFQVQQGEVLGIIGRNGAGKSTLLKILSRITEPTEGRALLYGRVGSLLEVGTGFHPELTGRENIYFNGTILGMRRAEISRRFDEIVAFAEIEQFLDTPVKHYSSGMYVRLAFAVAAHMETEILLVDEVLAVGDAAFQKKCMGKMGAVANEGRTVILVSHNMGAITQLCQRALLLDGGRVVFSSSSAEVVSRYLGLVMQDGRGQVMLEKISSDAYFRKIAVLDRKGQPTQTLEVTSGFTIQFDYDVLIPIAGLEVSYSLFDRHGSKIFYSGLSKSKTLLNQDHEPGGYIAKVYVPPQFLAPGTYTITAGLHQPGIRLFDRRDNAIGFVVTETGSEDYRYIGKDIGSILVNFDWIVERNEPKT